MQVALSFIGIVLSLTFVCVVMYRGWATLVAVPLGAIIVSVFSGINPGEALTGPFIQQTANLFQTIGPMFLTGSLLASAMEFTGGTRTIGRYLAKWFGVKRCCWVIVILAGLLSYGGMSFGGYMMLYPIAVYLVRKANYSRGIVLGCILGGSWTFASWGPFAPSAGNIYIQDALGTPPSAGLVPGMVAVVVSLVANCVYLQWQVKRWQKQGRGFVAVDGDSGSAEFIEAQAANDPSFIGSIIPPVLTIVLYAAVGVNVAVSCVIAWFVCVLLNLKRFPKGKILQLATEGISKAVIPAIGMGCLGGIGAVIQQTPAFETVVQFLETTDTNPYLICLVAGNALAAMLGSASGGVALIMTSMMPYFQRVIAMGYNAGNLHRILEMASLGLDSLPCNGTIAALTAQFKTSYKESYWPVFMTCTVLNILITIVVALPLALLGFT